MDPNELKALAQRITKSAKRLKDHHTTEKSAPVNYVCVFSHSQEEFEALSASAHQLGQVVRETATGPLFQISPLKTVAGTLKLLKVRAPDATRPEQGDADFTVADYMQFKKTYLPKPGFKLIERPQMEMIELMDSKFDVRAYFSHPPLDQQLGIS